MLTLSVYPNASLWVINKYVLLFGNVAGCPSLFSLSVVISVAHYQIYYVYTSRQPRTQQRYANRVSKSMFFLTGFQFNA